MKTVFLHGLGQTSRAWEAVVQQMPSAEVDCPELFSASEGDATFARIATDLERRCTGATEPLRLCGLSLGALLAMDYAVHHADDVAELVLIAAQYKVPSVLMALQNGLFRCMPESAFAGWNTTKRGAIQLCRSMKSLDYTRQLGEITCPVTLLCGERDRANLKASRKLEALLPRAELHIVPGAGHELNKDAPGAVVAALNRATADAPRVTGPAGS